MDRWMLHICLTDVKSPFRHIFAVFLFFPLFLFSSKFNPRPRMQVAKPVSQNWPFFSPLVHPVKGYIAVLSFFSTNQKKNLQQKKKLLNISSVIDKISRKKTILHRTLVTISCTYFLLHDLKKGFSADVIFFFYRIGWNKIEELRNKRSKKKIKRSKWINLVDYNLITLFT